MPQEGLKRRLAAILSADAKGYSRLMEEDKEATIRTITEYKEIITGQVTKSSIALLKNGIVEINERPE
jgi:adenylate cyclase